MANVSCHSQAPLLQDTPAKQLTLCSLVRLLEQSYKDRQSRARQMRKDTIKAITTAFNSFLHQRGFTGCLNMNQRDQELQLEVRHA